MHHYINVGGVINSTPILEVHATARKNHLPSKQTTLNPQLTRVTTRGPTHSYPPKSQKTDCSRLQPITISHAHRIFSVNLSHKE